MKSILLTYSNEIDNFSKNSLYERTTVNVPYCETVITQSHGNEIIRIIHHTGRTYISVKQRHTKTINDYLLTHNIVDKLCSSSFYHEILDLLGYDPHNFLLEPSEEFLKDIKYNCVHTIDYICTKNTFVPHATERVKKIHRGDEQFILDNNFDSTMYCVTDNNRMISCSYYKPNQGIFENTCAMQVFTQPEYRGNGYGKMAASAATQAVINENKLALWVCQVENIPSRRISESLGYVLLGGELRIVE